MRITNNMGKKGQMPPTERTIPKRKKSLQKREIYLFQKTGIITKSGIHGKEPDVHRNTHIFTKFYDT